jgi:hypothetical protein
VRPHCLSAEMALPSVLCAILGPGAQHCLCLSFPCPSKGQFMRTTKRWEDQTYRAEMLQGSVDDTSDHMWCVLTIVGGGLLLLGAAYWHVADVICQPWQWVGQVVKGWCKCILNKCTCSHCDLVCLMHEKDGTEECVEHVVRDRRCLRGILELVSTHAHLLWLGWSHVFVVGIWCC